MLFARDSKETLWKSLLVYWAKFCFAGLAEREQ